MQSQLLGLKSQINPHFLFNSLNSLSSLINEDEQEAEVFLDEMSKVYRYLLRSNDEELVTLQTELDFIRSYFYLLKTRLGRALELRINVPEEALEKNLAAADATDVAGRCSHLQYLLPRSAHYNPDCSYRRWAGDP